MSLLSRFPRLVRFVFASGLIFFLFMTLMRLVFYLFFNRQGQHFSDLGAAFWLGARFDARLVSLIVLPILVLGSFKFLDPFQSNRARKGWMIWLGLTAFILIFFYIVDFAHYAYLAQRLNASVLNYLQDAGISASMVWQSYPVIRLLLIIAVSEWVMVFLLKRVYKRIARTNIIAKPRMRIPAMIGSFLLLAFLIFGRFNQYPLRWSDAFGLGNDYKANLSLNPIESFFNTLKFRSNSFDLKKVKEAHALLAPYFGWKQNGDSLDFSRPLNGTDSTIAARPNIVLVICESFSAYKSSMWGNPLNTTPFFDSLSRQGMFFERCFTPTYGTARGVWATLTGLPDVEMPQTSSRNPLAVDQHTIMNDFNGYEKYYFIGGSPSWANIRGLLMNNIGNLHMYDQESLDAPRLDVWGISDKNLFIESNKILAKEQKPFFAIIQTADNHRPYTIPPEDTDFEVKKVPEDSLNKFGFSDQVSYALKLKEYNAFRYTDYTFKKFMESASREKYFANTLFVFVGDHGIAGDAGNMFPAAWTAQRLTTMHVPLLFFAPGRIAPKRTDIICSQIDIMPTLASMTGMPVTNTALGRNLLDTVHQPFAFVFDPDYTQAGILKGQYLYRRQMQTGKEEFVPIVLPGSSDTGLTEEQKTEMKKMTDAIYQATRYLLLNNKKKK